MNFFVADEIVKAVLYEGYVLYPYRPTSIKNQQRWTFGGIYPPGFPAAGASTMESQCLVQGGSAATLELRIRFLQPVLRQIGEVTPAAESSQGPATDEPPFRPVASLTVDERTYYTWEEAIEREIALPATSLADVAERSRPIEFAFPATRTIEPLEAGDAQVRGVILREQSAITGTIALSVATLAKGVVRIVVRIDNTSAVAAAESAAATQVQAQGCAFMSTHIVMGVRDGAFVSLIDPPDELAEPARACVNQAAWPVLIGDEGSHDTILCSPIILYDYPKIAPESPGDLFDGTEIDEILTLRILTMTDAEKREMVANDERARALLARTEALGEADLTRLHGVMRSPHADARDPAQASVANVQAAAPAGTGSSEFEAAGTIAGAPCNADRPRLAALRASGRALSVGDHVRLHPKQGGDIIDLALAGESAVIEAIEVDFENRVHVAVTVDADPGRDFGTERMPGHRFFFAPDEVEVIGAEGARR